jgi:hypothetical protein
MASWAIRSIENLPTLTSTWILVPSNIQVVLSTLVHRARALCDKEGLHDGLGSSKPLLGEMVIVSNRYDGPPTRRLEPPRRKRSPPRSLFFRTSRPTYGRLSRMLAKHNIKWDGLPPRKISRLFRLVKDALRLGTPGVYSIPCECGQVYIGQSGRSIETRI